MSNPSARSAVSPWLSSRPQWAAGRPDGCAVDAEGHVWNARYGAGCVVRIAPNGRIVATLRLLASQPTSCALGGSGLRTLFITTARKRLDPDQLRAEPHAGDLFAAEVDVPGLPDAEFAMPPDDAL